MQGSIVIEVGEKKLTDVTTSMKMSKKIHRKDRHTGEQERQTEEKDEEKKAGEGKHG